MYRAYKQNYRQWLEIALCDKNTSLIIVKATQVIYLIVTL